MMQLLSLFSKLKANSHGFLLSCNRLSTLKGFPSSSYFSVLSNDQNLDDGSAVAALLLLCVNSLMAGGLTNAGLLNKIANGSMTL